MNPTPQETIELLNEIADAEEGLANRVTKVIGARAHDVIRSSRRLAAECRTRASDMADQLGNGAAAAHA